MVSGGHVSGGTVTSTIVTFTVIAGVLTIARLYTRKVIVKTGGIDDLLCSIGLVSWPQPNRRTTSNACVDLLGSIDRDDVRTRYVSHYPDAMPSTC